MTGDGCDSVIGVSVRAKTTTGLLRMALLGYGVVAEEDKGIGGSASGLCDTVAYVSYAMVRRSIGGCWGVLCL
jgi:hypothetical protein